MTGEIYWKFNMELSEALDDYVSWYIVFYGKKPCVRIRKSFILNWIKNNKPKYGISQR
jgi:hypothetical protein